MQKAFPRGKVPPKGADEGLYALEATQKLDNKVFISPHPSKIKDFCHLLPGEGVSILFLRNLFLGAVGV